jgi:hypothetical protein
VRLAWAERTAAAVELEQLDQAIALARRLREELDGQPTAGRSSADQ